jgi:DNA-binding NarL/FixJ family response regulator
MNDCRVAVCDDVKDFRDLIVTYIERTDGLHVVGEAANGAEAIQLARAERPDVMLLDLAMPVMDGLEALPAILEACPGLGVVVLTGFASSDIRRKALAAGATGFLEKGERPSVIVSTVQKVCLECASSSQIDGHAGRKASGAS